MSFIFLQTMHDYFSAVNNWQSFMVLYGLMLLVILVMTWQSTHFYTHDVVTRRFSVMELELPATPTEMVNTIAGIFELPKHQSDKVLRSLKSQLWIDFLFMPLAYGSIALLCLRVSEKMTLPFGKGTFALFAALQLLPWICDVIENIYLFNKVAKLKAVYKHNHTPEQVKAERKKNEASTVLHKTYLLMEALKWGLALTATVCAAGAIAYFWVTGSYSHTSLVYAGLYLLLTIVFIIIAGLISKKRR